MWFPVSLTLWVHIAIADVENNGTYNHLLESQNRAAGQYSISYSSKEPLEYSYNEWFQVKFEGECQQIWKLDRRDSTSDVELPRKAYICNTDKLEIMK